MTIDKAQLKALALATFEHLPGVSDPKMIVFALMACVAVVIVWAMCVIVD